MNGRGKDWYLRAAVEYQGLAAKAYETARKAAANGDARFFRFSASRAASYSKQARANLFVALGVEGENEPA